MDKVAIQNRTIQARKDETHEITVQHPAFRMLIITHRVFVMAAMATKNFTRRFSNNINKLRSATVNILGFFSWPQIGVTESKSQ